MLTKEVVTTFMRNPSTTAYIEHAVRTFCAGATPLTYKQFMRIVWDMHVRSARGN